MTSVDLGIPITSMAKTLESSILAPEEGAAAEVFNTSGRGRIVLVCEHASHFIPRSLDGLGLDLEAALSHAAWDPGALDLALTLSAEFDAPLVVSNVSRLVYDCNRPPEAEAAMPARSERFAVPGNVGLSMDARQQRVREVYDPFTTTLAGTLDARGRDSIMVTIHSFTPVYLGQRRDIELGLLHDADDRLATAMLEVAPRYSKMRAALNQPYGPEDGVTHTLVQHALPRGMPNLMVEVRNDLLVGAAAVDGIASQLAAMLRDATGSIGMPLGEGETGG